MAEALNILKRITAKWEHDIVYYTKLPDTPKMREHKRMARRAMLGKKITTLRDHTPALPRGWLMDNS